MPLRHLPFGISEADLGRLLHRRHRAHLQSLTPLTPALADLRAAAAETRRQLTAVQQEIAALQAEAAALRYELGEPGAEPPETGAPADPTDPLGQLRLTLQSYRFLQTEISAAVFALITPFLTDPDEKEGTEWPGIRTAGR